MATAIAKPNTIFAFGRASRTLVAVKVAIFVAEIVRVFP
jgi:hypothetical protein